MAFAGISTVGQGFAYAAAGLYILSMVVSLLAQLSQGGVDTPRMDAAKAAGQSVERIAGNFLTCKGCAEDVDSNVAMIKEIFLVQSGEGWTEILDGMMVGSADLLIIAAMLSLKTQMAMKQTASTGRRRKAGPRQPDEFELIMITCFALGMTLPLIDFLFSVGPRFAVGEIARIALTVDDMGEGNIWNNFGDEQWRSLYLSYTLTESLFQWTNVMALLLQSAAFLVLGQIGERAGAIWHQRLAWLSRLTGGIKMLGFICGMLQGFDVPGMSLGYAVADGVGRIAVIVFLILLGQGLGTVASLSTQQGLEGGLTATSEGGRKSKMAASVAEAAEEGWAEGLPM